MKRILALALALVLCLGVLASCGEKKRKQIDPLAQVNQITTDANGDLSAVLPIDDHEGKWNFKLENPDALTVIKNEMIEGEDGVLRAYIVLGSNVEEYTEMNASFTYTASPDEKVSKGYNLKLVIPGDGLVLVSENKDCEPSEEIVLEKESNLSLDEEARLVVTLETNPSTGYHWEYAIAEGAYVEFVSEETVEGDSELDGAPATWKAVFKGIVPEDGAPHPGSIVFTSVGPDGTASDETFTATFLVYSDGSVIC